MKRLVIYVVFIFSFIFAFSMNASAEVFANFIKHGGSFSTSDLEGTWHLYFMEFDYLAPTSLWGYGTVDINASGNIVGGTYYLPDGSDHTFTDGNLTITADGKINGTINTSRWVNATIHDAKMDQSKTFACFVGVSLGVGSPFDYGILIKKVGSFSDSDLEGTWYQYFLEFQESGNMCWGYGMTEIDLSGEVIGGEYALSDGTTGTLTSGDLAITADGNVSGNMNTSVGVNVIIQDGKMDQGKTNAAYIGRNNGLYPRDFGFLVRGGGSFAGNDLPGTWHIYFVEFMDTGLASWIYGSIDVDASGHITGGNYIDIDGSSGILTGGSLAITADGEVNGNINTLSGDTITIEGGKMDQGRTSFFSVNTVNPTPEDPEDDGGGGGGGGGCLISTAVDWFCLAK